MGGVPGTAWVRRARWEGHARDVSQARAWVTRTLQGQRLDQLVDAARLVVSELATNAVEHAATAFVVTLVGDADTLTLQVFDTGTREPDHPLAVTAALQAPATAEGGRGFSVVAGSSSAWGVERHPSRGTTAWARFDHMSPGPADQPAADPV